MTASSDGFEIVCEIQPPTAADLAVVREQIAVLRSTCDAFLVPDSHLGRATVSSIAVAHEVGYLHGRAIACLNARDRNLIGLERDLLTAAAYGVEDLLFVYGDEPTRGERGEMTVQRMLAAFRQHELGGRFRIGVAGAVDRPLPDWKLRADAVYVQVGADPQAIARWREDAGFGGRVYAGVLVLASRRMADRIADVIPGFDVPADVRRRLAADEHAGTEIAVEQVLALPDAGVVDGVHLIPARRYREVAAALARARL